MNTENQNTAVAATGIAGLDAILGGGLPREHLYLLEGGTGTGKTTLALKFILEGVRRGERALYITLSETAEELRKVAASHGWSLDGVTICELPSPKGPPSEDQGYTLFHPSEVEQGKLLQELFAEVERVQPARLVLDTLAGLRLLAESPLHHRQQIQRLRQFLTGRACTTLLVDEPLPGSYNYQPSSLVHGILYLERHLPTYGKARRRLAITKLRGLEYLDSYHDFKIITGDLIVYPHLVAAEHAKSFREEQISSGVSGLDALLGGGLGRGQSTLLLGPSGSGKSTVAMQYAMAAASRGERCAVYLFDESVRTFFKRGAALGMDVQAQADAGHLIVTKVDPAAMSTGEFAYQIRQAVEHDAVRLVIIDSLGGYLHAMPEQQFLPLHLHELLAYLGHQGVVTLLIMVQPGLIGPGLKSLVNLSSLADTIILLRFFEARGQVRKAISVIKNRSGPHERTIRELRSESTGIQVGPPLEGFQGILTGILQDTGEKQPASGT